MRHLAQALDTGPASLYVYVANRDELWDLVFDAAVGSIETEPTDPARWREQLHALAGRMLTMMVVEYPGLARLAMAHIPVGDNALRVSESVLSLLKAGGVGDQAAAYAADLLSMYVTAIAYEQSLYALLYSDPEHEQREVARIAQRFAAISPERFPTIAALRDQLTTGDGEERFSLGLDVLINGVARDPDRRPAHARRLGGPGAAVSERWFVVNVRDAAVAEQGRVRRALAPAIARCPFGTARRHGWPGHPARPAQCALPRGSGPGGLPRARGGVPGRDRGAGAPAAAMGLPPLPAGDPGTPLVGAGEEPCTVLMVGAPPSASLSEMLYPADLVAARYGASMEQTTRTSKQAYAGRSYNGPPRAGAVARRLTRAV